MSEQRDEHQLGEEERLLEAIADQQKVLADAVVALADKYKKAPHQRKLGQLEFKYQLLLEKKRLSSVLAKFESDHGALYSEPCLVCLDNIHVHASRKLVHYLGCCGGFVCVNCSEDLKKSNKKYRQFRCPLCRNTLLKENEYTEGVMKLAKRGVPWAQTNVGFLMEDGGPLHEEEEGGRLEWYKKAAAQNYPPALFDLSNICRDGLVSGSRKSQEKANELLLKSANLGFAPANYELATFYFAGTHGFEENPDEAYFRASVAFALEGSEQYAALIGCWHHFEYIVPAPSPYLACYYLNIAANGTNDGIACFYYSEELQKLSKHLHGDNTTGMHLLLAAYFWARKARDLGCNGAREWLNLWEKTGQSLCACCGKETKNGEKFKQCSQCKSQWYCSKDCQIKAWKAGGHKKDCKRAGILNFEDYLNSE